ncbi:MAG: glutamate synthase large subunit [Candidatus Marinimicrobia bacterium]|nr:glutamate synthase large subunit [Candidatus Neomarinimicrobiota bacterium]
MMNNFKKNAAGQTVSQGLYDPRFEHDACGIGFIANINGKREYSIVENGITVLQNMEHRGAVGGDAKTGDGAGLLFQIPDSFYKKKYEDLQLPSYGKYGTGLIFLPNSEMASTQIIDHFNRITEEENCAPLGWKNVDTDNSSLGQLARSTEPDIKQVFIGSNNLTGKDFQRKLYIIRRRIEKYVRTELSGDNSQFYIPSLSHYSIIYKGLLTSEQLRNFYLDLQDPEFKVSFCIVHQRFSTNTLPSWNLAQPFRYIAHNGEINTLRGNINRMKAREAIMQSPLFGEKIQNIKPIIDETGSDSAIFDNVLELLVNGGRSLPHSMMMMVPEATSANIQMSEDKRAFYEFHSSIMEPWDGPASLVFCDERYLGATLDRNGLRPSRYIITDDDKIILSSETGVLDIDEAKIKTKGRLQPGKMLLLDFQEKRVVPDKEIKSKISRQKPYRRWVKNRRLELRGLFAPDETHSMEAKELLEKQFAFGYTEEVCHKILRPMARKGQEAIGSMGNDTALTVLSKKDNLLFNYFKQMFAQVTNPPIDPLREELVMSLESFLEKENNILEETSQYYSSLKLHHPILSITDLKKLKENKNSDLTCREIDILYTPDKTGENLETAMVEIFRQAEQHIQENVAMIILTDKRMNQNHAPIPSLLAAAGLHHHLLKKGLRTAAAIIVESGEIREIMHFALLLAYGTDAICPYLAYYTIDDLFQKNMLHPVKSSEEAMDRYITAVKKGLLKTFSRMGISTLHSFWGNQIFEAVGINKSVIRKYFTGTVSRIGGLGLKEISDEVLHRFNRAFSDNIENKVLDSGGEYRVRKDGEQHFWDASSIHKFQKAVRQGDYLLYKEFTTEMDHKYKDGGLLRGLLKFKKCTSIDINQVEPVESIVKRFVSAAMSMGSISKEAHETIAIAMNRLGAKSNSGEGGEDPERAIVYQNGDTKRSRIRQVASARFGVTTEYLVNADEIQIKMAQGAKPGEGGQLPGHKVSEEIAKIRHTTPGVTLISPPPHHDIYSIEDLAQLIFDLKKVTSNSRVSVKLVSEAGVGTIASGVAKAKADMILISGQKGGTGASPLTAIKHAGLPWELGLAETQQSLVFNGLRKNVRLQVDGQLKTGRDLAIATLLGAEEFGFGTSVLICVGCVMMRKCHKNTCPVGVATQDARLRGRFTGKPEYIINFMHFIARELREIMAQLGFATIDEMVGRVDRLDFNPAINLWKAHKIDLSGILNTDHIQKNIMLKGENELTRIQYSELDNELLKAADHLIKTREPVSLDLKIRNINRTIGAEISGKITKELGIKGLKANQLKVIFTGSAGQSFGAFLITGINFKIFGDVNDYLGKGMSGGKIVVVPSPKAKFKAENNVICGNVVLFGATGGEVFIRGRAGERFCVRNSGATAVVEGIGDHGCEYMTGGKVVVLGETGKNFAAGMSGGIAYVYDNSELFDNLCNLDMVDLETVWHEKDQKELKNLIKKHLDETGSEKAKMILEDWEVHFPLFVKVMPIDYKMALERISLKEDYDKETLSVTEEVYDG